MKAIRTDLALEARELWQESAGEETRLSGVIAREEEVRGHRVHRVKILNDAGAKALGKPIGNYSTVELCGVARRDEDVFPRAIDTVADELAAMLPAGEGCVLVVGLGNRSITPDAVGSAAIDHVMVTRHLVEKLPDLFGSLRQVSAIAPGVLGMTGMESREVIAGVAARISPVCIIVIDALASRRVARLCHTIQITDTGIIPGSGVGNARAAINRETLGVPVIAVGVPTVVDISAIVSDIAAESGAPLPEHILAEYSDQLMVTPKEIDVRISDVGRIIGYAINSVLQPGVTLADMDVFLS